MRQQNLRVVITLMLSFAMLGACSVGRAVCCCLRRIFAAQ